jgi:dihydropteroate synthase
MSQMRGYSVYPEDGYGDVVRDVLNEWRGARDRALEVGLEPEQVFLDPGLGFGKNARQSFELLARLDELSAEGASVLLGPSRKSFIAAFDGAPPDARLGGTIAACLLAVERGASVLRVHDVGAVRQALDVARAASPSRGAP